MEIIDKKTGMIIPGKEVRNSAMFTHLAAFGSLVVPFGNILGPLIVWQIKKDQSEFVDENGKESINFQITYTIVIFVLLGLGAGFAISSGFRGFEGGIAISIVFFIAIIILYALMALVFVIIASIKASKGEMFRYPMSIRFIA
jgi:uncharacterized Tic20 family protein